MSDFKIKDSIDSYYFSFDFTGKSPIDRILQSVANAGNGSHSTDGWADEIIGRNFTLAENIQVCANFASAEFDKLNEEIATLTAERDELLKAQRNSAEIGRDAIIKAVSGCEDNTILGGDKWFCRSVDIKEIANNLANNAGS